MKRGFALIELMVYLALTVFTGMLVLEWAVTTNHQMQRAHEQTIVSMTLQAALEHCARDLRAASEPVLCVGDACYVWKIGNEYVGWERDGFGRLMRSQGSYDLTKKIWRSRTKSCTAEQVTHVAITGSQLLTCAIAHKRGITFEARVVARAKEIA